MATLPTQSISHDGLSVAYSNAASAGDQVIPTRRTFLHVKNAGASASVTVTVDDTLSVMPSGAIEFDPDISITIGPDSDKMIGPIVETRFQNADGLADIGYSSVDDVTIAAISV